MGAGFCPELAHCHACVSGFYGQLQTFCPPHYPDSQRTLPPSSSCSMVPAFEDCLVPTSMGQTGFDVFHRAFSTHSGITGGCLGLGQHEEKPGAFPVAARDSVEFRRTTPEITSLLHLLPWLSPLWPPAQRPAFLPQAAAVSSSDLPLHPLTCTILPIWHCSLIRVISYGTFLLEYLSRIQSHRLSSFLFWHSGKAYDYLVKFSRPARTDFPFILLLFCLLLTFLIPRVPSSLL